MDDPRILVCQNMAEAAHTGQKRKHNNMDYICHPARVYQEVTKYAPTVAWLRETQRVRMRCAAWLHDVIEDCRSTFDINEIELATRGLNVFSLVWELTNPSSFLDKTKFRRAERKGLDLEHWRHTSQEARMIKLCDRMDNLNDLSACTDLKYLELYAAESSALLDVIGPGNGRLWAACDDALQRLNERIQNEKVAAAS